MEPTVLVSIIAVIGIVAGLAFTYFVVKDKLG